MLSNTTIYIRDVSFLWQWDWLIEKDDSQDYLPTYVVKINKAGYAFCKWCNEDIKYANGGKKDIKNMLLIGCRWFSNYHGKKEADGKGIEKKWKDC